MTWFITFDFISLATLDMYILSFFCFTWGVKAPALCSTRDVILLSVTMLSRLVGGSKALRFALRTYERPLIGIYVIKYQIIAHFRVWLGAYLRGAYVITLFLEWALIRWWALIRGGA